MASPSRRRPRSRDTDLRALERLKAVYGPGLGTRKLALLRALERARLATPGRVARLHEALCFLRAYPDDARVLRRAARLLGGFDRRADLRRHARRLADSGIAGTAIRYRFYYPTACWLAARWPDRIRIDWKGFERQAQVEKLLPLLAHPAEIPGLDEYDYTPREWIARMKSPRETDAAFFVDRFAALPMDEAAREILYDDLDPPLRLAPGRGAPSRTHPGNLPRRPHYVTAPLARGRPRLEEEMLRPPVSIRAVGAAEGRRLIDLAREAMVTRARDLDAFTNGDPRDVRIVDDGRGLAFACIGPRPERRQLLETVYGYLTLKNGVPIGYVLTSALFGSCEVAYNVFETFRGGEAAMVYGRVLAMARALFGADSFMIPPYQLGEDNEEGLASGAWWFYWKLGFRPRDRQVLALARRELARMKVRPAHRSSLTTLRRLAAANLYFQPAGRRDDVLGRVPLADVGLAMTRYLAHRFGARRVEGAQVCADEARALLGVRSQRGWTQGERLAWDGWSPLLLQLPGVRRWSRAEQRALVDVVRAKGGRRESEYVLRFDRHPRLRRAILRLARSGGTGAGG